MQLKAAFHDRKEAVMTLDEAFEARAAEDVPDTDLPDLVAALARSLDAEVMKTHISWCFWLATWPTS